MLEIFYIFSQPKISNSIGAVDLIWQQEGHLACKSCHSQGLWNLYDSDVKSVPLLKVARKSFDFSCHF